MSDFPRAEIRAIPTLDLRCYENDSARFARDFGASYRSFGFCCIEGHGIAPNLIADAYAAFRKLFALPEAVKRQYHLAGTGGARGYTPFGIETAVGSSSPDLKEFWHVGREFDAQIAAETERLAMPPNPWPQEVPEFRGAACALYRALDALGARLLRALALDLSLDENWFDNNIDSGNSILRPLHYPPLSIGHDDGLRSAAHADINLITLLVGASDAGLQIQHRDGCWLPVTTQGDAIVVNAGDMLQRLSNGIYSSTAHRVVSPSVKRQGDRATRCRFFCIRIRIS